MNLNKLSYICQKLSVIMILSATLIVGSLFVIDEANAVQIGGGWGQDYWNANFTTPGWGNFGGGGGDGGGGGGLTEADMKLVIEALIDPLFKSGNINFEQALTKNAAGQAVYDKMVNNTNPEYAAYYQSFVKYVNTPEGRQAALDNLGNLLPPETLLKGDFNVKVDAPPTTKTTNDYLAMGYSPEQAKKIQSDLAKNPNWLCDGQGYYYLNVKGEKVRADTNKPALMEATKELGMPVKELPCYGLDLGLDPYAPAGINDQGTGFVSPPSNPTNPTTPTNTACTSYTYSDWSACVDNNQTRSITTKSPSGCSDSSSAVLTQSCVSPISPVIKDITSANQKSSRPLLAVTTNRAATCQFNANGGFTYPAGTIFDTTGGYNHNAQLPETANGKKVYYVVCKDNATGGMSEALKIEFTVNVDTAPIITSVTPAVQTGANPALSVITDRPAACQYKKDATFVFGAGTPIATNDNYNHSVSIAALADGAHSFYVLCKNNDTGAVSEPKQIGTTLQRTAPANAPAVTNTTAVAQTASNPVLSVATNIAAACQYQKDTQFTYGQGLPFSGDSAKTTHRAQLSGLAAGAHTYYVICKNDSVDAYSAPMAIMFVVNIGAAEVCADLSSNDRKNNANRSYWGSGQSDSTYLWQSVETGTRDKFDKVDWHAGYQFTPERDGKINQLCGNFAAGVTNRVSLYDGAYKELAGAEVFGNDSWRCVDISPVEIKTDKRYYVIARIKDNPVYFEYKSAMLPKKSGNAVIEAGIRQAAGGDIFENDIRKYDYMVFGLVDVRASWQPASITGPTIVSSGPSGAISSANAVLSLQAAGAQDCRFGREDVSYGQMSYLMVGSGAGNFTQKVCDLENGGYTFYVRCRSAGGAENNVSAAINFTITQ